MAARRRLTAEEIAAAQQEARRRMKVANIANRELQAKQMAPKGDGQLSAAEGEVQQRLAQEAEQVRPSRGELERVPTRREVAVEKLGGGAIPGNLHNERGDYRTVLKDGEVHHIYGDGTDRHFKVDNMAERQALAAQGVDYGQAQRTSGQDASTFREGMAKIMKADPSVRQQWLAAIAKQNGGHAPVSGQDQPVGASVNHAEMAREGRGGPEDIAAARQKALMDMQSRTGGIAAPAPSQPAAPVLQEQLRRARRRLSGGRM